MNLEDKCKHSTIEKLGTLIHQDRIDIYRCVISGCKKYLAPYTMGGTLDIENYKQTANPNILDYHPHESMSPLRATGLT